MIKERIKYIEQHLHHVERKVIIKDLTLLLKKASTIPLSTKDISNTSSIDITQKISSLPQSNSQNEEGKLPKLKLNIPSDKKIKPNNRIKKERNHNNTDVASIQPKSLEDVKVVCEKCDKYMDLFKSLKNEYYRCRRFPRCNVTGDLKQVEVALKEKIVTKRFHADSVKLYRYDEVENVVFVSEVTKEKGLLNSIDDGVWR